jgi:hypothetical protein
MKLTKLPKEFEQAKPVLQRIEAAGYDAYFVGGSVRDTILGQPNMRSRLFGQKKLIKIFAGLIKSLLSAH